MRSAQAHTLMLANLRKLRCFFGGSCQAVEAASLQFPLLLKPNAGGFGAGKVSVKRVGELRALLLCSSLHA
eukprot:1122046-Pleurochrysis_carterae.AAC.2